MKKSTLALVGAMAFATTFAVAPQAHAEQWWCANLVNPWYYPCVK